MTGIVKTRFKINDQSENSTKLCEEDIAQSTAKKNTQKSSVLIEQCSTVNGLTNCYNQISIKYKATKTLPTLANY